MNKEYYHHYLAEDFYEYSFYSEGPKGRIKKSVIYTKIQDDPPVYNLAFGDFDNETKEINDKINTNNDDRDIVLATVANTINDFSNKYGNNFIFAAGSTPSRTRLYQIGIFGLWDEIEKDFYLWGYKEDNWREFQCNVNYEAFLIKKK
ncbi:hypothetical protein [Pedobacter sp. L105]|uniref:DUF6934 family protein n=1 Tax=Pedobacter sp. L105 TaxID=1641871 RepID=UPI00131CF781|nr:hypothetical protein [Pedobacter sp. L105]